MAEDTTLIVKSHDSRIFNCSVRSIIALLVVTTVCFMSLMAVKIEEPLYTLAGMVLGYYMGQNTKPKNQQ